MRIRSLSGLKPAAQAELLAAPGHVYVGRKFRDIPGSPLGNPHTVRLYGRQRCIEMFRQDLWLAIQDHQRGHLVAVVERVLALADDATLICWCLNAEDDGGELCCHAQVISRAARYLRSRK